MTIESALFSYLSTKASVIAEVGARIFPQLAPESAPYPYLVYSVINDNPEHEMDGAAGLANVNMQIDVWCETIAERVTISEVIRNALDGFKGSMGTENLGVSTCFLTDRSNFQETDIEGKPNPAFRSSMDFNIWHVESLPTL